MDIEVAAVCGAGHGERSPERENQRNGYRPRQWDTRDHGPALRSRDVLARRPPLSDATLRSTNPLERVNKEIKRRTDVVGICPNREAVVRLVSVLRLKQNDEWAVSRRYMPVEKLTAMCIDPTTGAMIAA